MSGLQEAQWQQIHSRHAGELWRFVLSLTQDRGVAEDVVQEVMLRAWRAAELSDREEAAVRAWLFTVARHLVIDRSRSAAIRRERSTAEPVTDRRSTRDDPTDQVLDQWLIADALAELTADHRAVVLAAYYEGRSTRDIAERLQIAEGTVKSRLHYGIRHLRMILQEKGVTTA